MPEKIEIRATYLITDLPLLDGSPFCLSYKGAGNDEISLSFVTANKKRNSPEQQEQLNRSECTVSASRSVPQNIMTMFGRLASGKLPGRSTKGWESAIDADHKIKPGFIVSVKMLPDQLREVVQIFIDEFSDSVNRAVNLLRWYALIVGPHSPARSIRGGIDWSIDNSQWHFISSFDPILTLDYSLSAGPNDFNAVQQLLQKGVNEPFCHQLFRESWEQKSINPRSSLVIGMAAAEIGVKEFIADFVPQASWLVENIPSPPLLQMLTEYLPTFKAMQDGQLPCSVPKFMLQTLREGVKLRNKIAHSPRGKLDSKKLHETLEAVRDLLFLLDYYRGFSWVLPRIRSDTRAALNLQS
ncbi:hypothetical protein IT404_17820 [Candidatus Nomurabacteria bacterium]|nr:hypothetical protein [Candidatus Nomurabacteria bacterium]